MKISELKEGLTNIEIEARVVQLGEVRQVNTRFGPRQVADNILEDDSGQVKLTLWGDDIQKVKIGDTVKLTGAYVKAWQGDLQIATGRNGSMEVVSGAGGDVAEAAPEAGTTEAGAEKPAEEAAPEAAEEPAAEEPAKAEPEEEVKEEKIE